MLQYLVNEYTVRQYKSELYYIIPMESLNTIQVQFQFDKSWDGYVKTAQFTSGDTTYNMMLVEDKTYVPPVLFQGRWNVSVFGLLPGDDTKRWTTVESYLDVVKGGYRTDGTMPVEPPPDYYRLLIKEIRNSLKQAENAAKDAKTSEERCEEILAQFNYDLSNVDEKIRVAVETYVKQNVYTKDEVYNKVEIDTNIQKMQDVDIDDIIGGVTYGKVFG